MAEARDGLVYRPQGRFIPHEDDDSLAGDS
jgi:hypothetical protein